MGDAQPGADGGLPERAEGDLLGAGRLGGALLPQQLRRGRQLHGGALLDQRRRRQPGRAAGDLQQQRRGGQQGPDAAPLRLDVTAPSFDGIVFQANSGGNQATAYVDDIELIQAVVQPPGPVTVAVDPTLDRRTINPLIYGVNWADSTQLATGLYTANRRGGNATTRYNWIVDTSNRAFDYYFLNISEGSGNGTSVDGFVTPTLGAGAATVLTMPIDQVAKSSSRTPGFSTTKYGPQTGTECDVNPGVTGCSNDAA